jgi:hypothetical protein
MARGDYAGETFGEWFVESRAKPQGGKRFWNVTNTVTDEKMVVAQTELKSLATLEDDHIHHGPTAAGCCAEPCVVENCQIVDGKHEIQTNRPEGDEVPSSSEITARVLIGNYANDPFNLPDGVLPEDDSEYPFEVAFVEPVVIEDVMVDLPAPDDIFSVDGLDVPDDEDAPTPVSLNDNIRGFVETLVANMAESMTSFVEEWRVIVVDELLKDIKVNGEPVE